MSDLDECRCGDYRKHHAGPEHRGSCRICRDGTPPPLGPDGCQRFRLAFRVGERAELAEAERRRELGLR